MPGSTVLSLDPVDWQRSGPCRGAMVVTKVQLVSVPVTDQHRSRDSYVDALGFDLVSDTELDPGQRWVQVRPVGAETSLTLVTWFETMTPGSSKGAVIDSSDLDADVESFQRKGVVLEGGIQSQPWGRFATFHDPDGNGLILPETSPAGS